MKVLDRKLLRDLWAMRAQAVAIALVIACGVSTYLMSLATLESLYQTRQEYYRQYRFAQVWASLKRAPEAVAARAAEIPGVERVESRVVALARLEVAGFGEPVKGLLVSVPDDGRALLNGLFLRRGRLPDPLRNDEVVIGEPFAEAHGLEPGDAVGAIINGHRQSLTVTGIGLSPEYVYQVAPGAMMPDNLRFGVLWMGRTPLEAAFGMKGAFNDLTMTLTAGADEGEVLDRLDDLLEEYGGLGAFGRDDQTSHRFLSEEFKQLGSTAWLYAAIFLGVAAFLLGLVVSRLVETQREQVAAFKAFGYSNAAVALHYLKLVLAVAALGLLLGVAGGTWLGHALSELYIEYYRFPWLAYRLPPEVVAQALGLTLLAAVAGTLRAVRRAALAPPAQAMRPEPPPAYRRTLLERLGLQRLFSQPGRMILRHLERRPLKMALTVLGIGMACAIMVVGTFFVDAMAFMTEAEFRLAQRQDLTVTFTDPSSRRALFELAAIPGVEAVEPFRSVPARLRHGHLSYRTAIQGLPGDARLRLTLDRRLRPVAMPPDGLLLSEQLAKLLAARPGDTLTIEVLEGARPVRETRVAALVSQYLGVGAYMEIGALNRLMREGHAVSGAYLTVDEGRLPAIYDALHRRPRVAAAEHLENVRRSFTQTMDEFLLTYVGFVTALAGIITFGVVYNSARIALAERSRELASLRVLGFTRGEISYILLGELGLLTLLAIPPGLLIGRGLSAWLIALLPQELFTIPLVIEPHTYALAALVVLGSSLLSALVVRRRLDRLDLVAVLKTKE